MSKKLRKPIFVSLMWVVILVLIYMGTNQIRQVDRFDLGTAIFIIVVFGPPFIGWAIWWIRREK